MIKTIKANYLQVIKDCNINVLNMKVSKANYAINAFMFNKSTNIFSYSRGGLAIQYVTMCTKTGYVAISRAVYTVSWIPLSNKPAILFKPDNQANSIATGNNFKTLKQLIKTFQSY